jgi:hypothetical protein
MPIIPGGFTSLHDFHTGYYVFLMALIINRVSFHDSNTRFVFVTEKQGVFCEVQIGLLNTVLVNFFPEMVKLLT